MMQNDLIALFQKDLAKLRAEVESFASDEALWIKPDGIPNSAGNLTLHLLGNLNHYIGAKLGNSGYVRNRPLEFSSGFVPRTELLERIDKTIEIVTAAIGSLSDEDLRSEYEADPGDDVRIVATELIRILTHLNYHLGQINYYRRLTA